MSLWDVPRPHQYPSIEVAIKRDAKRFQPMGLVQYKGKLEIATWHHAGGGLYVPVLSPWRISP